MAVTVAWRKSQAGELCKVPFPGWDQETLLLVTKMPGNTFQRTQKDLASGGNGILVPYPSVSICSSKKTLQGLCSTSLSHKQRFRLNMYYSPKTSCTAYANVHLRFSSNFTSDYPFCSQEGMLVTPAFFFLFGYMSCSDTNMQKAPGSVEFCWKPSISFRLVNWFPIKAVLVSSSVLYFHSKNFSQ